MTKTLVAMFALVVSISAFAAELVVGLPGRESLVFDVPAGWSAQVQRTRPELPPTIVVVTADPRALQFLITPSWPMGNAGAPTSSDIRALAQWAADEVRSRAVEATLPLTELVAPDKSGFYFFATDRQPEPDGFKYMTQGFIGFDELRITFTVLVNGEPQAITSRALEMLRSSRRTTAKDPALAAAPAHAGVTDTPTERQLSLPSANVRLGLPRGDWVIMRELWRPGDTAVYYALSSERRQLAFSVYIDKTSVCQTATRCRELAMMNPAYKDAKDLTTFELGNFSVSQFYLDQPQGLTIRQSNVLASAYVEGHWFDIHISRAGAEPSDQAALIELLKEVSIK